MKSVENSKREKLKAILSELSENDAIKNDCDKQDYLKRLKQIYFSNDKQVFNHYYSDIFPLLTNLKATENNITLVGQNLEQILEYSVKDANPNVYKVLKKLWDHTNLEIARIEYVNTIDKRLDITGSDLSKKYKKISEEAQEINTKQQEINETIDRIKNIYSEFISILGIFSAIVLVYFGGTSIIGNVLDAINETYIFKAILICLVAGMIVFNIIFMFLYFLAKILDRSIAATNQYVAFYSIFDRFKMRYPIIFYTNILLLFCIVIDCLTWIFALLINNKFFITYLDLFVNKNYVDMYYVKYLFIVLIILFNTCYTFYYLCCKFTDKLIGRHISLIYTRRYKVDGCNLTYYWGDVFKSYRSKIIAKLSLLYYNYVMLFINTIKNFTRRVFVRHRVFSWGNIVLILLYVIIKKIA